MPNKVFRRKLLNAEKTESASIKTLERNVIFFNESYPLSWCKCKIFKDYSFLDLPVSSDRSYNLSCVSLSLRLRFFLRIDSLVWFLFFDFGQACPIYPGKFAISLWHLKKEARNENRNLTALVCSNTTLTIYYMSIVRPPLTLFLSQYGIHTKPFLHFINCLCNISTFLFQVVVVPWKLACYNFKFSP